LDNVEAELTGTESDEIVLVTAHLDSTINRIAPPYDPETDPAPGADDDASGVAAVLAIAKIFQQMAGTKPPKRTIRFVLFNAEEQGLVGSQAYARTQAALAAPIVAVYQMDMIGYNVKAPRSFEVHAGYRSSEEVQNRSLFLAQRLDKLVKQVSPALEFPQIYTRRDPADGRSDHASFQQRGYAACATSEDMFMGPPPDSPEAEPNPNYHKETDTFIDFDYAADIARAVAAAAWVTANA
jgi:Zn-dependent M28 family amino/carboxypeptidase